VSLDQTADGTKWDLQDLPLPVLKANLNAWQVGLAEVGWNSLYWNNHDQPRAVSRYGDDSAEHRVNSAKTLGTVLHLLKGTPYVYQGEELGMTNTYFTEIGQYADVESVNYHADALSLGLEAEVVMKSLSVKSRDNARTPVQWDDTSHAGFTQGMPWLPVNPNYVTINAAAEVADPNSVFHHYRQLIQLRHHHPAIVDGWFELLLPDDEQIFAYTRTRSDETLLVLANCSSSPAAVDQATVPDLAQATVLLATHPGAEGRSLAPWESRVYLLG
jgi:oligo-1,6-glucosidase